MFFELSDFFVQHLPSVEFEQQLRAHWETFGLFEFVVEWRGHHLVDWRRIILGRAGCLSCIFGPAQAFDFNLLDRFLAEVWLDRELWVFELDLRLLEFVNVQSDVWNLAVLHFNWRDWSQLLLV